MRHIQLYSLVDRRQRRKTALARSMRRRLAQFGLGCGAFALLILAAGLLTLSITYAQLVEGLPSLSLLPDLLNPINGQLMQPTRLYDRTGQQLLLSLENPGISRRYLPLDPNRDDHLSPELIRVTIGLLDPGYWRGAGFSLRSLTSTQPVTIAERLVDELLLWREPPGLRRALRMRILAAQVTASYGHVQVLEWYLNSASFGHMAYGVDSAARLYLDHPATQVNLAEAALLLAASQAPALNPLDAPAAALERQRLVLDQLRARGVITAAEHARAVETALPSARVIGQEVSPAPAFSRLALDSLSDIFGRERLERGGLRIITTLDYNLQIELACLVRSQLARLSADGTSVDARAEVNHPDGSRCASARLLPSLPSGMTGLTEDLTASAVVFDPKTGQVLALLGDTTNAGESGWLTPRAPGSLLSPFVAVTSFARGIGPATLTWDIPSSLPESLASLPNPDGKFHGPVRLRLALANDYLAPQVQMLAQMGAPGIWRLASAFGMPSLSGETAPELIYQGGRVSALELAQAYAVFANQGVKTGQRLTIGGDLRPALALYVEGLDGMTWLDASQPESQTVVSAQLAYMVHNVLSDEAARRPSLGFPNPLEFGRPAGAKIGQVTGNRQVWTAGYTPQHVAVFWLGLPEASQPSETAAPGTSPDAASSSGGETERLAPRLVAGMWHAWMQFISRDLPAQDWPEPPGLARVDVCDPSGLLPTAACPDVVSELFLAGSEPTGPDSLYRDFQINRETGRLATVFTPAALIEEQTFFVVPSQARTWAQAAGLPLPPVDYDAIQPPEPSPSVRIDAPAMVTSVRGQVEIRGTAAGEGFRFYQVQVGQGLNPQTWLQVGADGSEPVEAGLLASWDTQGQEGLFAVRLLVVRQNQQVETATIQVTVDNTPPVVRVPYPETGQVFQYAKDQTLTFQAQVSDAAGLERVVWVVNGKEVGQTLQPPYVFTWPLKRGDHSLEVRAYDQAGNEGISEKITFSVR